MLYHDSNGDTNAPQCYVYTYTACLVLIKLLFKFKEYLYSDFVASLAGCNIQDRKSIRVNCGNRGWKCVLS